MVESGEVHLAGPFTMTRCLQAVGDTEACQVDDDCFGNDVCLCDDAPLRRKLLDFDAAAVSESGANKKSGKTNGSKFGTSRGGRRSHRGEQLTRRNLKSSKKCGKAGGIEQDGICVSDACKDAGLFCFN